MGIAFVGQKQNKRTFQLIMANNRSNVNYNIPVVYDPTQIYYILYCLLLRIKDGAILPGEVVGSLVVITLHTPLQPWTKPRPVNYMQVYNLVISIDRQPGLWHLANHHRCPSL